jgi:RNA polymerase sigma-70 factor (ECF subfamily)
MSYIDLKSCEDPHLIGSLIQKDEDVFGLLYRKYWPSMIRLASLFISDRDTCNEIVQELFISLYTKRDRLKISVSLSSYLYVSLRNRIRNHIRKESIYSRHVRIAGNSRSSIGTNDVEQFMGMAELEREISVCLSRMPEKCREVYLMYQQTQGTLKHMAIHLNRPVDTVEKQLRKAIRLLRIHLSEYRTQR